MKMQEYKDGILVNEYDVPDEPVVLTPDQAGIAALNGEIAALRAEMKALKITLKVS